MGGCTALSGPEEVASVVDKTRIKDNLCSYFVHMLCIFVPVANTVSPDCCFFAKV